MGRHGHHIRTEPGHVHGQLARCLNRIGVQQRPMPADDLGRRRHRLDHAGFVVRQHDGNQRRRITLRHQGLKGGKVDDAVPVRRDDFGPRGGFQNGRMLDRRHQQAFPSGTLDRQIIGFRAAAGEHHPGRRRAERPGHLFPCRLHMRARPAPGPMHRGPVACLGKQAGHDLGGFGPKRGRRVIVKISAHKLVPLAIRCQLAAAGPMPAESGPAIPRAPARAAAAAPREPAARSPPPARSADRWSPEPGSRSRPRG